MQGCCSLLRDWQYLAQTLMPTFQSQGRAPCSVDCPPHSALVTVMTTFHQTVLCVILLKKKKETTTKRIIISANQSCVAWIRELELKDIHFFPNIFRIKVYSKTKQSVKLLVHCFPLRPAVCPIITARHPSTLCLYKCSAMGALTSTSTGHVSSNVVQQSEIASFFMSMST